jgi:hypothetical protein
LGQMQYAQRVRKACMACARVGVIADTQLVDSTQSLNLWAIQ